MVFFEGFPGPIVASAGHSCGDCQAQPWMIFSLCQLLPFVSLNDHQNGGHVFTPEKVRNKTPKCGVTNGRTWRGLFKRVVYSLLFSTKKP